MARGLGKRQPLYLLLSPCILVSLNALQVMGRLKLPCICSLAFLCLVNSTRSAFYLVDVPGVGFAKVSLDQKAKWAAFFKVGRPKKIALFKLSQRI